ncbi:hypothetical protein BDV29DRAFT_196003 [Aspergillus leporis]|uniref:Uncharacterized protein n=1 Tax=Aspergillus leporis TaxID=41062 RepID=A0A5N5WK31_9EURO|nr:hypothetical protein BDV29DRAFT_196003 [Aspergillus leporis]
MADYQFTQPPNGLVFRTIIDWAHEKADQIVGPGRTSGAYHSKGEWEGWAPEEQAADFVLTPDISGKYAFAQPYVDEECLILDLKCESYFNTLNFAERVEKDIKKVDSGVLKKRLLRGGRNFSCIALAVSNQGAYEMGDSNMELFEVDDMEAPFQLWVYNDVDLDNDEDYEETGGQDDEIQYDGTYGHQEFNYGMNQVPSADEGYNHEWHSYYGVGY